LMLDVELSCKAKGLSGKRASNGGMYKSDQAFIAPS